MAKTAAEDVTAGASGFARLQTASAPAVHSDLYPHWSTPLLASFAVAVPLHSVQVAQSAFDFPSLSPAASHFLASQASVQVAVDFPASHPHTVLVVAVAAIILKGAVLYLSAQTLLSTQVAPLSVVCLPVAQGSQIASAVLSVFAAVFSVAQTVFALHVACVAPAATGPPVLCVAPVQAAHAAPPNPGAQLALQSPVAASPPSATANPVAQVAEHELSSSVLEVPSVSVRFLSVQLAVVLAYAAQSVAPAVALNFPAPQAAQALSGAAVSS